MYKKNRGYTLTELMVTVGVIGVIGSITAVFYMQLYRSYCLTDAKTRVTQIAINSLGSVQKQLREVTQKPTCTPNTTIHPTQTAPIGFYIPSLTDPTTRSSDDYVEYYNGTVSKMFCARLTRAGTTYPAISVIFDFDKFRVNPTSHPQGGGVIDFLRDPTLQYDDVAFYYDDTYNMINVGVTVSVEDKGKKGRRQSLTLTTALAIRNTF